MSKFVSIVLPTLNGSRYVTSSVNSILQQSYSNFELIVVDGGSTDNTLELIKGFNDPRIQILSQANNNGRLPGAINVGLTKSNGEYLTWAQDDDWYELDALQTMVAYLDQHPTIGLVYCGSFKADGNGDIISESVLHQPSDIFHSNPVGHCFLYRRSIADKVGFFYDEKWLMVEDYEYWIRIYKNSHLALIPNRLYYHRLHSGSLTDRNYGGYLALRLAARLRKEKLGINYFRYLSQVSDAYIQEGFAANNNSDVAYSKNCFIKGIIRNPLWLYNRGVLSILSKSKRSNTRSERPLHDD